jgi:hypothetical protein
MMNHSESILEVSKALVKAQAGFQSAAMNAVNPFLKNRYADLGAVIEAVRPALISNGLTFLQPASMADGVVTVETVVLHESGEYISESISLAAHDEKGKSAAQVTGSIITYLRRYGLSAMLGVYTEEDNDGGTPQTAAQRPATPKRNPPAAQSGPPEPPPDAWDEEAAGNGSEPYLDVSEVGVFLTKAGKPHIGLMEDGHKWPDIRWWKGRDELLTAAPWLGETVTKEQLGTPDARFPFAARVYYSEDDKGYKAAERFERI